MGLLLLLEERRVDEGSFGGYESPSSSKLPLSRFYHGAPMGRLLLLKEKRVDEGVGFSNLLSFRHDGALMMSLLLLLEERLAGEGSVGGYESPSSSKLPLSRWGVGEGRGCINQPSRCGGVEGKPRRPFSLPLLR